MNRIATALMILPLLFLVSFAEHLANDPWQAPAEADRLQNPLNEDSKATAKGAKLFMAYCWTCHGADGRGKGPASDALQVSPPDLGAQAVQQQTDGAIYWKVGKGRGEMASYAQVLTDKERWALVNHIRTLGHE